jgi:hypothetical protein
MNYEGDKAILPSLSGPPQSIPSTTEVDSKWTVRSDFDTTVLALQKQTVGLRRLNCLVHILAQMDEADSNEG